MLRFKVYDKDAPAGTFDLDGAHLIGSDNVPMRADLRFEAGEIICEMRTRGAAALSVLWPVQGYGRIMLSTTRLPERQEPYNLHVELARGRLMRISQKREEWGLFDFPDAEPLYQEVARARDLLIDAMTACDDVSAARTGNQAIDAAMRIGEKLATFHAEVFLKRRQSTAQLGKHPFGCGLSLERNTEVYRQRFLDAFDVAELPLCWRAIEPKSGEFQWEPIDSWLRLLKTQRRPVHAFGLVDLTLGRIPDWALRFRQDPARAQNALGAYVKQVLKHFGGQFHAWEAVCGLHAFNAFNFSFEQLVDITRNVVTLVKQMAPRSAALIGVTLPWGEYYAADQRTIPPVLYAEMTVSNGINFDAFVLEIRFGASDHGLYVRDMMQISSILDRFGAIGKPLHVRVAGVPSSAKGPWSEETQGAWANELYHVALSKPFVETVVWNVLADTPTDASGLLRPDFTPKVAYQKIVALRRELIAPRPRTM